MKTQILKIILLTIFHQILFINSNSQTPWVFPGSAYQFPDFILPEWAYNDCNNDVIDITVPGNIYLDNNIFLTPKSGNFKAGKSIVIKPGTLIYNGLPGCSGDYTRFEINNSICDIVMVNILNGKVKKYDKIEIGVDPSDLIDDAILNFFENTNPLGPKINPYNPDFNDADYIDIIATFTSPSNRIIKVPAFFYREYNENLTNNLWDEVQTDYPFRIRFSPDEVGDWDLTIDIKSNIETSIGNRIDRSCSILQGRSFICEANSDNLGYLEVGHHKSYLRFSENGKSFFATAFNVCHAYDLDNWGPVPFLSSFIQHRNYFNQATDYGANFIRVSFDPTSFGLEWEKIGVYDSYISYNGDSRNRQENAWEMDRIVNLAKTKNVYLYVEMGGSFTQNNNGYFAWSNHPYSTLPGVTNQSNVYTDPAVKKNWEAKLRYMIARWGYSTNIGAFEIANEIDWNIGYTDINGQSTMFSATIDNYFLQTAHYLKDILHVKQLLSVSYSKKPTHNMMFTSPKLDICDIHHYGNDKNVNFEQRYNNIEHLRQFNKPCIQGEMGMQWGGGIDPRFYESCNDVSFHNAIWSSTFMGSLGCGANWWWFNAISENHYDRNFVELATFINTIDFEENKFTPNKWRSNSSFRWRCGLWWPMKVNYYLENYQLTNFSKTRAVGWFHNATWYWANLASYYPCVSSLINPCDDDTYNEPKPGTSMPDLKVEGLKGPFKKYYYDFYRTRDGTLNDLSSMYWRSGSKTTNWIGDLNIGVNNIDLQLPGLNDFAYKVYEDGYNFREEVEDTTELYALKFDTVCVGDTIKVKGIYENDSLCIYSYNWNFGNGLTSNLCQPSFWFQTAGNYICYYIVTDSSGNRIDSVGAYYNAMDCSDTLTELYRIAGSQNDANHLFTVYPNPSKGIFYIKNDSNVIYNYFIYNITGALVESKNNNNATIENFDISEYSNGLFLIRLVSNEKSEIYLIIKQ